MIKFEQVSKTYGKGEAAVLALSGINLEIQQGEFVGIMGASGSGKSTLLNLLGLADDVSEGKYIFKGEEISNRSVSALQKLRVAHFGYVMQNFGLINELNNFENVLLALKYAKHKNINRKERVNALFQSLGISEKQKSHPNSISGGQKQRVAIARALANKPDVILADEPTGALDSQNALSVMQIFKELHAQGQTIVMVTHDDKWKEYFTRIIRLKDGKIIE